MKMENGFSAIQSLSFVTLYAFTYHAFFDFLFQDFLHYV